LCSGIAFSHPQLSKTFLTLQTQQSNPLP
jgi:hypothetical protein